MFVFEYIPSADYVKEVWKRIKNSYEVDQGCIYQFRYNSYVPVNPESLTWNPVQSSLNTSASGHVLHFLVLIRSYKSVSLK
jgi:hypothetical protein